MKNKDFLKDVFISSLGAYGGPQAHMSVFLNQLVINKKYLTEEELIELNALCSILPGPTSTQTIVAIGYKLGGRLLAFLTMLVWALPVIVIMTLLSFYYPILSYYNISNDFIRFVPFIAISLILVAAVKIAKKVINDKITLFLAITSSIIVYFNREAWVYPLILIFGGLFSMYFYREKNMWTYKKIRFKWSYIIILLGISFVTFFLKSYYKNDFYNLIYHIYRYGYLVFGGGQVVIPLMYNQLVDISGSMSSNEFLAGYGIVQGLPGPMFSFSSYAGGMAFRGYGVFSQALMGFLSGILIFLPGNLLIYFIYPVWDDLKKNKGIKIALRGINAVSSGIVFIASIILFQKIGFSLLSLITVILTFFIILWNKIPIPALILIFILGAIVL